jgi:hypothetical protein
VSKKTPRLPHIEDATLQACLAPLMEAMHVLGEPDATVLSRETQPASPANSNENPRPLGQPRAGVGKGRRGVSKSLSEWRALAEDDFGVFRTIGVFMAMTDAELEAVAAEFPRQIAGTLARIAALKQRLGWQYDMVTTITALLERAGDRVAARTAIAASSGDKARAATE